MRIGIMVRSIDEKGGIGVYTRNITHEQIHLDRENQYVLFYPDSSNLGRFAGNPHVEERVVRAPNKLAWGQVFIPLASRPILEECLYRIAGGSAWPGEIILVDQGSNSEVGLWIEQMNCAGIAARHVLSKQRGRAAGLNQGLETALTEFVVIGDGDCFVAPDWLANMAEILGKNPGSIVTGRNVSVQHQDWRDRPARMEQYHGYARSQGGYNGKYIRQGDLFILTRALVHHFRAMRRWGTGLVAGNAELAASGKAYFTGLLPGIIMGLRAEGTDGGNER